MKFYNDSDILSGVKDYTVVTDPGIDDIVALVLLHKLAGGANTSLVASFGNAPEEKVAKNAEELIAFVAPQWRLMHGAKGPLSGVLEYPWPDYFHGPDGVWGVHPPVSDHAAQPLAEYPDTADVVSLAPMTDVYKLLQNGVLRSATVMGGAFGVAGNETQYAETNIAFDPDAAQHFFSECRDVDVRVVPLDVTRQVVWTRDKVEGIPETTPVNKWLKRLLLAWFDKYNHEKEDAFNLHDPLAVYLNFFPEKAVRETRGIEVVTHGKQRGRTIWSDTNPPCKTAVQLHDAQRISEDIFSLVFG